jgi:hypothetical protein
MTPTQTPAQVPAFIRENRCQTRGSFPFVIHTIEGPDAKTPIIGSVLHEDFWSVQCWPASGRMFESEDAFDLIEIPEAGGGAALRSPDNHLANVILSMLVDEGHCRPEAWPVLIEPIAAIIRKHAPEPQRAEEPKPPEPAREWEVLRAGLEAADRLRKGEYLAWANAGGPNECRHGRADSIPCLQCDEAALDAAITVVREVRPEPASVATPLPEGVPALDGEFADFEYSGTKRLVGVPSCGSPDIILFDDIEGWMKNYCGEWWDGSDDISHKAIRRGTELHRLNFGGLEADGNAASPGAGAFRFFLDNHGTRWKANERESWVMPRGVMDWCADAACKLTDLLQMSFAGKSGIYECDSTGTPLEGGGA